MKPGDAVTKLAQLGYHFEVAGDKVRYQWQGQGEPDPSQVCPLFEVVKAHKEEVREFLRVHCSKCGGVCFGTFADGEERCMTCYYQALKALFPGLEQLRH